MKKFLSIKKNINLVLGGLLILAFAQALVIAKLWSSKNNKNYEVNLVKINTQKDSVDYTKMKNDLQIMDNTVQEIRSFLAAKNIENTKIEMLNSDSLSSSVYLAKQSNRYSQYLMDLQIKLMQVPLGIPTDGYISSNFGKRKNPIPYKTVLASAKTLNTPIPKPEPKIIEEKDSLGNVVKRTLATTLASNESPTKNQPKELNNAPAEADQIQFHKGIDIAVAYGSDVRCAAQGTVIFAGQKGGYGNCVIVSHGNGLATLYAHLSEILVKSNDVVKVNSVIAKSGNSGRSTGPHLHYEVHKNNTPVNPKLFMSL